VRFGTAELAAAVGGRLVGDDLVVEGVTTDSRTAGAGRLFVPLAAARDGHDFIDAALAGGAVAYLTSREPRPGTTAIVVPDTLQALGAIGRLARSRFPEPKRVIAVTGSVGKTTVKDLLAATLSTTFRTVASERSFNNEIGVPVTLANAPDDVEAAAIEMGARGSGHIADLCAVALPTIGVVTTVGHVHTEAFGTIDDVARGKGELVESLPSTGVAVLNADDDLVAAMAGRTSARVVAYGTHADVSARKVRLDDDLRPTFVLASPWGEIEVRLAVRGHHQVGNALAAAAGALAGDVPLPAVAEGLAAAVPSPWRMELHRTSAGALVLNDAYNANPISVAAALRSLAAIDARRRVAVLGTMAELGDFADNEHRAIGALARELGIDVIAVGESRYGAPTVAGIDDAVDRLGRLGAGDAVLVKGSRVAGLERLAERLTG
jgi:UDP-N-acetylmuramoyl-tripeptide--D-alanyl-D-alanine ligase